jgi:hypothetical protein
MENTCMQQSRFNGASTAIGPTKVKRAAKRLKSADGAMAGMGLVIAFGLLATFFFLFAWGGVQIALDGSEADPMGWLWACLCAAPGLWAAIVMGKLLHSITRFGKTEATVYTGVFEPEDSFNFSLQRDCKRNIEVRTIHLYFVFLEVISYRDPNRGSMSVQLDRPIGHWTFPGGKFGPLFPIRIQRQIHLPAWGLPGTGRYMMKAYVETGEPDDYSADCLWRTFEVDVGVFLPVGLADCNNENSEGLFFDVIVEPTELYRCRQGWENVFKELLPSMREREWAPLLRAAPFVLLRRITLQEAETAKQRLEEVGIGARYTLTELENRLSNL